MTFNSIEAIGEAFKQGDDVEIGALFAKGAILVSAAAQGWDIDECAGYCASLTMRTKRTVYRYYSTVRTFPKRMFDLPYEHHAIAADTIDYRQSMTPDELETAQNNALKWLHAAKENEYSTRALRAAIAEAGGRVDVRPEVLLDGVEAVFVGVGASDKNIADMRTLYLRIPIDSYEQLVNLENETAVKITLLKALSEEAKQEA